MVQTVRVYCLAPFTADEADEILTQLEDDSYDSYSSSDVRVDLIPWTEQRDGGKDAIFKLFFENQEIEEDFMFFFDRTSLHRQDFLVADVRAAKKLSSALDSSSMQCTVAEFTKHMSPHQSNDRSILFGRCGGDDGWYGNPYSSIKKTYISLTSGQATFDEVVRNREPETNHPYTEHPDSSELDFCDKAYSAQIRSVRHQADLLSRQLQVKTVHHGDDSPGTFVSPTNSYSSFQLPGPYSALRA